MAQNRSALIVAVSEYQDAGLRQLVAPAQDAEALARVLGDPAIGGFAVKTLLNQPSHQVNREIEAFFANRARDDLLLLYFSGHGLKDEEGRLYFATPDTDRKFLRTTAVAATLLNEVMQHSRSRRQVLILDCCYSGAFARGMTHRADEAVGAGEYFREGRGQFVLTASDALQYAFEGDAVRGEGVRSVFTYTLVRGLETGEADLDGDGAISCDELYDYLHERVTDRMPQQKPRKWAFDVEGQKPIVIARNPRSPSGVPYITRWSAQQVQTLQQQTAQALGLAVQFSDRLKDGSQGPLMVVIPGGRFSMGSPSVEPKRGSDERQHEVEVKPFAIGMYAVTFEQYDHFAKVKRRKKPSDLLMEGRGRRPVIDVSYYDAMAYAAWLSQQTGQTYRLPTEAEWEYACRAGTATAYYFGASLSTDLANNSGTTLRSGNVFPMRSWGWWSNELIKVMTSKMKREGPTEVGRYPANAWGLYDMHGNVLEWTCSAYDPDYGGGEQRCAEPDTDSYRVLRGGSWFDEPGGLRSAARCSDFPHYGNYGRGFRLARTLTL